MGGGSDRLAQFVQLAARLDDDALAAIGNKGLLRRAHKDAGREPARVLGLAGERLQLETEGQRVELSLQPADSRCDCPASGVCRHILAAWITLARTAVSAAHAGAPEPESNAASTTVTATAAIDEVAAFLALDDAALQRWATVPVFRRALSEVTRGLSVAVASLAPLCLRLPELTHEVRTLGGGTLQELLCSCHARTPCEHRVAAVLALQVARGARRVQLDDPLLRASVEAPRDRGEVLAEVEALLVDVLRSGLVRSSPAQALRARNLATAAHGCDLPRLTRALTAFGAELELLLARTGRASSAALLARASGLWALSRALRDPRPGLVGRHRARYLRTRELQLTGLGARAFETRSGYLGLSCYFWDLEGERFCSWSEARVLGRGEFDPVQRFRAPGPWTGCRSPEQASRSRLRLSGAYRSSSGTRLSGRESTRMVRIGPSELEAVPAIDDWRGLLEPARASFGAGLDERQELSSLVVLKPSAVQRGSFDAADQSYRCHALDREQRALTLVWDHDERRAGAVSWAQASDPARWQRIVGSLRLRAGALQLEPIAVAIDGKLVSPTLLRAHAAGAETSAAAAATATATELAPETSTAPEREPDDVEEEDEEDGAESDVEEAPDARGPLGQLLAAVQTSLLDAAERGTRDRSRPPLSPELRERLLAAGLSACAVAVTFDAGTFEQDAQQLLRAAYIAATTQRELALRQALEDALAAR